MKEGKSLITRLLEKKYDLNNVYIGLIGRQYKKEATTKNEILEDLIAVSYGNIIYRWGYKPVDRTIGLFVKTIGGYKRISSGEKYKEANHKTIGEVVLVKDKILPLINVYADLYWRLKEKYKYITPEKARFFEDKLNENQAFVAKAINTLE